MIDVVNSSVKSQHILRQKKVPLLNYNTLSGCSFVSLIRTLTGTFVEQSLAMSSSSVREQTLDKTVLFFENVPELRQSHAK